VTSPYVIITALWLLFWVSTLWVALTDPLLRSEVRGNALPYVSLLVAAIGFVVYATNTSVALYGLEYEDAFEYAYSARFLALQPEARLSGLNSVCVDGSLLHCASIASLSHTTGLAVLASWLARATSSASSQVAIVSAGLWGISASAVCLVARRHGLALVESFAASASLVTVPIWFTLGSSSLAEPTATGIAACVLLASYRFIDQFTWTAFAEVEVRKLMPASLCITSGVALAACVKREQMLLALALPLLHILRSDRTLADHAKKGLSLAALGVLGIVIGIIATHGEIVHVDVVRPGAGPLFSFAHLEVLASRYLGHLFDWGAYNAVGLVGLVGLLNRGRRRIAVALLAVATAYAVMFCSFAQTYSFEKSGQIPLFHFQRYTLEIAPYLALLFSLGLERIRYLSGRMLAANSPYMVLLVLWLGFSLYSARLLRHRFSNEETVVRFRPVTEICNLTPPDSWTITTVPILYALSCGNYHRVISLLEVGRRVFPSDLGVRMRTARIFFQDQGEQGDERYRAAYGALRAFERIRFFGGSDAGLVELKQKTAKPELGWVAPIAVRPPERQ
jgi:hypothetical protein